MTVRSIRDYELVVNSISIRPPLNVVFSCNKSIFGSVNDANFEIYNLNPSKRSSLIKDREEVKYIPVEFKVGYNGSLETVFKGNVQTGTHQRAGVDFINKLHCFDGGFDYVNSFTSKTVRGKVLAVESLISDMPNIEIGKIELDDILTRPKVMFGNTSMLLEKYLEDGKNLYIDNEQIYIVNETTNIGAFIPLVTGDNDLLDTPQRENKRVTFTVLMNPAVKIGGRVELKSKTAAYLNGTYKVEGISYSGSYDGNDFIMKITGTLV